MSSQSSLRPAWNRGSQRGFPPPPTVASERNQSRSQSGGGGGGGGQDTHQPPRNDNKFAALDSDEDEEIVADNLPPVTSSSSATAVAAPSSVNNKQQPPVPNARSEGLKAGRSMSTPGTNNGGGSGAKGRSLADLAARAPPPPPPAERGVGRHGSGSSPHKRMMVDPDVEAKVTRITREKLLSLRPMPPISSLPGSVLDDVADVILVEAPQDPVCFDDLDVDAIWAKAPVRLRQASVTAAAGGGGGPGGGASGKPDGMPQRAQSLGGRGMGRDAPSTGGRWQRGVALPPPERNKSGGERSGGGGGTFHNPDDLWDDPVSNTAAAADFSAFGAMPEDDDKNTAKNGGGDDVFDFEKMAAASAKLDAEMHGGSRSRASSDATDLSKPEETVTTKVDSTRPLASGGMTIRAGSGDHVNVFEDFDDPAAASGAEDTGDDDDSPVPIKAMDEDPTASSRLMAMIGVKKEETLTEQEKGKETADPAAATSAPSTTASGIPGWGTSDPAGNDKKDDAAIPLNPWGGPLIPGAGTSTRPAVQGLDLQARLREVNIEQQKAREAELLQLRQQEEAKQRELAAERQRVLQQQQHQQPQQAVQSQVELALMERVSILLESSWGHAPLGQILQRLHAQDSRVVPLLNSVDVLRALLLRNSHRVAVRHDPSSGDEVAVLVMTNTQWQQREAASRTQQAQQEEMQRRHQEQQRLLEQQQRTQQQSRSISIDPDALWYYSDPQRNIQGPFRGDEMRQWFEAGYFKGDLPISQRQSGPFVPLSAIFMDQAKAFVVNTDRETRLKAEEEESVRKAQAEREALLERQRQEQEAMARAAREREENEKERMAAEVRAREEAVNKSNGGNESSTQLKMMLGLSSSGQQVPAAEPSAAVAPEPSKTEKRSSKSKKQSSATQNKQPIVPVAAAAPASLEIPPVAAAPKPAAPAWGGAASSPQAAPRKSMSEIQKEEARAAALAAMNRESTRSSSSGWANVAASKGGSQAWQSGTVKATPNAAVNARSSSVTSSGSMPAGSSRAANAATNASSQRASNVAEEFGAKMSPALEKWCKEQMLKLNGTDDITLLAFCMSLEDPSEIRQYLTAYLGATPGVNSFANEFIQRKGGAKAPKQEEWETTGTVKRKAKKKTAR